MSEDEYDFDKQYYIYILCNDIENIIKQLLEKCGITQLKIENKSLLGEKINKYNLSDIQLELKGKNLSISKIQRHQNYCQCYHYGRTFNYVYPCKKDDYYYNVNIIK
jgi:hypothetical protein